MLNHPMALLHLSSASILNLLSIGIHMPSKLIGCFLLGNYWLEILYFIQRFNQAWL
ncbi:MAG: hypothetical protein AB1722_09670 [Pseudomonadota bacterium]